MDFEFPDIINHKIYCERTTPEQDAFISYFDPTNQYRLSQQAEQVLSECIQFYKSVFSYLKCLNYSEFTQKDADKVIDYVKNVFSRPSKSSETLVYQQL